MKKALLALLPVVAGGILTGWIQMGKLNTPLNSLWNICTGQWSGVYVWIAIGLTWAISGPLLQWSLASEVRKHQNRESTLVGILDEAASLASQLDQELSEATNVGVQGKQGIFYPSPRPNDLRKRGAELKAICAKYDAAKLQWNLQALT